MLKCRVPDGQCSFPEVNARQAKHGQIQKLQVPQRSRAQHRKLYHLKDAIEILIREGHLKQYAKKQETPKETNTVAEENPSEDTSSLQVAMSVTRPKDFYIPNLADASKFFSSHSSCESFRSAMVISGGGLSKLTVGSVKRKFGELITASSSKAATLDLSRGSSTPLALYKEELPRGAPNATIPLLICAWIANFDVRRIPVDQGSFVDIMYSQMFSTLQLNESHLTPYIGSDLQGFNDIVTKSWGFMKLIVYFDTTETTREVKVQFLVIDFPSIYQCILGRPTMAELIAVLSTVHLKMKYYTAKGQVATLHGDIKASWRCFEASTKGFNSIKILH